MIRDLYTLAEMMAESRSKLLSRLKEALYCLKDQYKRDFRNYTYDYDKRRLVGGRFVLQWVNEGTNSVGHCYLYVKGGIGEFENEM